jgi:4-aminobutyrate aminotransferase/(S)-3-amino-2-methylpropionate transaminase
MDTREKYRRYVNTSFVAGLEPVVVANAQGATVVDETSASYIDCFAGIAVVNARHRHPDVIAAAKRQMDELVHCCSYMYYVRPVADFAERLAAVTPGALQKTFFGNGGAEAIEGALRLAKASTGCSEFVALQGSFHGRTNATLSVSGNSARKRRGGPYLPGVAFAPAPYRYRCRYCQHGAACTLACTDAVENAIRFATADHVAAFIAEPVMGEGGIIVPPEGYFARVEEILARQGILFIADEVQSGFGRTGRLFAIEHYQVEPDIMVMAKGIADGFPLSAFIAPPAIADAFQPGEHLSTFGGNPVACAAGLANLGVMLRDDLPGRAARLGEIALERLRALQRIQPRIGDVRGVGLMIGVELVSDPVAKTPAAEAAIAVRRLCRERGVLIGVGGLYGNVLRIQPPLVIGADELTHALDVLAEALGNVGHG